MYVIIVYDVSEKRVNRVCKFLRMHLNWIQNSVFEGELSKGQLKEVKMGLGYIIKKDEDSILLFTVESEKWIKKEVIGIEKREVTTII
ncbi:MAG: CRISPR-associated endonuclease Cas2 [Candidatus Altiarchaeales archaeon HGW-Altiarchaeales-3]|nr:MAG: CRISPR-associated endonuclease Cas2 [Candidatus Altiarchaeales archaeon HGW-Altiarchaeales-3]